MISGTGMGSAQPASLNSASDGGSASQALHVLQGAGGRSVVTSAAGAGLAVPISPGWGRASLAVVAW